MTASEKIRAAGVDSVACLTGRTPSVVYRWIKALDAGRGVSVRAMRELIAATSAAPYPITWSDFAPADILGVAA